MKKTFFLITTALLFATFSCKKDDPTPEPNCTGDCLFALSNAEGVIVHLNCFNKFAIKTAMSGNGDEAIYGIPDGLGSDFSMEGKSVKFSASFHENELTPTLPDPAIDTSSLYQIKLSMIEDFH